MPESEDYYSVLGVSPNATAEEVKKAYLDKSYILHPDRLAGAPVSARQKAEAEFKKVNVAYDTLKDRRRRSEYDLKFVTGKQKPRPVVEPQLLRFTNVKPGEVQSGTFVIRNLGGPYTKVNISNPNSWVKVVKWSSLTATDELPLRVEIEAKGDEWGKSYLESAYVRLDEEEARVTIQLQTMRQPAFKTVEPSGQKAPVPPVIKQAMTKGLYSWVKLLLGLMILASFIGIIVAGMLAFTHQLPPLVGAASFIGIFVLFVVLVKVTRSERYRWRKPGFALVFWCLVGIYLVLTFSGVQPLAAYKDFVFNAISSAYQSVVNP